MYDTQEFHLFRDDTKIWEVDIDNADGSSDRRYRFYYSEKISDGIAAWIFSLFWMVEEKIRKYDDDEPWESRLEKNKKAVREVIKECWLEKKIKAVTKDEVTDKKILIMDPDLVEKERLKKEAYENAEKPRDIEFVYENNMIDWVKVEKELIKKGIYDKYDHGVASSWTYMKKVALDPESELYCSHLKSLYELSQEEREKTSNYPIAIIEEKIQRKKKTVWKRLVWLFKKEKINDEPDEKTELELRLNDYCDNIEGEIKETEKWDKDKAIQLATKYMLRFYDLSPFPQDNWRMARYLWNLVMIRLWLRYIKFLSNEKDKFFEYLEEYKNTGDQSKMQHFLSEQFQKTILK